MKFFFDTEFTGLQKNTDLISIGIIDYTGEHAFYAEFTDYDITKVSYWVRENVIQKLVLFDKADNYYEYTNDAAQYFDIATNKIDELCLVRGDRRFIRDKLEYWLKSLIDINGGETVQMISDVSHYDFVLFADLFGGAFGLPEWISPACYDINQDIARKYKISPHNAFEMSRASIVKNIYDNPTIHNSLNDAIIIGYIYHVCNWKSHYHMSGSW